MNEMRYQLDLLKAMNQKLNAKEKMYRMVCDTSSSAFLYYSFENQEVFPLGKWTSFFDFTIKEPGEIIKLLEVVDKPFELELREALFPEKKGEDSAVIECQLRQKRVWLEFRTTVYFDENGIPTDKIIAITNVSKFRSQNEELAYMAYYDSLTGLYNRNYFVLLLGEYVRKAKEANSSVSVLIIDIDDFRKINDGMGMIVGDELVQQFGDVLKELCAENMIACHLTSDIYCMAIYNPIEDRNAESLHKAIKQKIKKPFRLSGGQELTITVSVGVAEFPEAADTALDLINCAEIVMFKAKAMGKNMVQYFDTPILNDFLQTVEIENKLKEAVFNQHFSLNYQPQYYTDSKKLRGVEALIRWKDDDDHSISPAVFIPIAEKNGAIIPIGQWVVEQSVRQHAEWSRQYGYPMVMSINISAIQYQREDFVEKLMQVLNKYQVKPEEIELEITESILIDDFVAVSDKLTQLRTYGVRVSLDDFGTGFSSLSYLKKLPINTLKIDKSFIDTVLSDAATRVITESIVNMVKSLGFETVAEGVEAEQQYKYLHAIGCDVIQGYLFGKPQTAEEIEKLLANIGAR